MPDADKKKEIQENADSSEERVPADDVIDEALPVEETVTEDVGDKPAETLPDPDEEAAKEGPDDEITPYDDEKTDEAIDEIVAKESDDVLAAQDAAAPKAGIKPPKKRGPIGRFFRNKWVRSIFLLLVFGGIAAAFAFPASRYWALNTAGVRSSSSLKVVDSTTQLPLKGVHISLNGQKADTDSDGEAQFEGLRLGPAGLTISQVGFERIGREVVIGWGSNPLGDFALKATGVKYVIEVRDYLSGKPIEGVEATDGAVTARSDKEGKITLSLRSTLIAKDGVTLSKPGYRQEKITLGEDPGEPAKAVLVPARKAVFVTKQSGKYDVYKSDLDGKNREVLLPGTGHENSNVSLAVSPDGKRAALVSTRANKRDSSGFLTSSLLLINTDSGAAVVLAEAQQVQLIDWIGPRIIYQLASSDGPSDSRRTLSSYHYSDNARFQLASSNRLNSVISVQGTIYYAVGADTSDPSAEAGLFRINPDGKEKQRIVEGELTNVLRSSYDTLSLQAGDGTWQTYDIPDGTKTVVEAPASLASRLYIDNSNRTRSLWVSQGTLKSYDVLGRKDTDVNSQSGLTYPLQWLSGSVAVYRVSTGSETADYAVSLEGGSPHKVADVAPTYGLAHAQ